MPQNWPLGADSGGVKVKGIIWWCYGRAGICRGHGDEIFRIIGWQDKGVVALAKARMVGFGHTQYGISYNTENQWEMRYVEYSIYKCFLTR